jgi:hypothetical protein
LTGLLLATLVNLSPGIQLADNVGARHVALSGARLPLVFVSDDDDGPRPSIDAMTREQLAVELRRLDENRPSLGGPIALLSVGVALCIPGAAIIIGGLGAGFGFGSGSVAATVAILVVGFGAVLLTVGVILALVGSIKLASRIGARGAHAEEMDEVRKRIDTLDQTVPPIAPQPSDLLPPPPPPPQANLVVPGPLQTVMTF